MEYFDLMTYMYTHFQCYTNRLTLYSIYNWKKRCCYASTLLLAQPNNLQVNKTTLSIYRKIATSICILNLHRIRWNIVIREKCFVVYCPNKHLQKGGSLHFIVDINMNFNSDTSSCEGYRMNRSTLVWAQWIKLKWLNSTSCITIYLFKLVYMIEWHIIDYHFIFSVINILCLLHK